MPSGFTTEGGQEAICEVSAYFCAKSYHPGARIDGILKGSDFGKGIYFVRSGGSVYIRIGLGPDMWTLGPDGTGNATRINLQPWCDRRRRTRCRHRRTSCNGHGCVYCIPRRTCGRSVRTLPGIPALFQRLSARVLRPVNKYRRNHGRVRCIGPAG